MKSWSIEECESYAKQLRDISRANTAEHAAQAIEFLLSLVKRTWVGLTDDEIEHLRNDQPWWMVRDIEAKLKEKNND
jgi:hypothetical protein